MVDLFKPVRVEPVLTDAEKAELHEIESEAILVNTLMRMSPYDYVVSKDGHLRRVPKQD